MWNGTGTFRAEFSRKIRNGPRFKMRWNLFRFVPFFELVWNVSAIPGGTERNWQPCYQALSLRSLWPCNNTRLISPKNMSDSRWIMNNFVKWSWKWDHRWEVHVHLYCGSMDPGTCSLVLVLLLLLQHCHCSSIICIRTNKIVMNIWILYYSILFLHISIL